MPSSGLMSTSMIEQGWAALNVGYAQAARDAFEKALDGGRVRRGPRRTWSGALPAAGLRRAQLSSRSGRTPHIAETVKPSRPQGPRAIWRGSLGMCSAIGRFTTAGWHGRAGSSTKLVTMVRSTPGC